MRATLRLCGCKAGAWFRFYIPSNLDFPYWLSNHDRTATNVGGVGGKSVSLQEK